ncbi:GDSL-type esterase/lipase family protein [Teredinibacter haidensis]|uniref:GDSL-type esterase/lipase family protein n=1 Tax=Teredinibacter haidensis TaxID=2731755 RepID=UPI0009F87CFD|nr:GDSL-type esterase/lipase family protein [Teredinibacter haidensis]
MRYTQLSLLSRFFVIGLFWGVTSCASVENQKAVNTAIEAAPRSTEFEWMSLETWHAKHQSNLERAKTNNVDLLFLGDSITEGWFWGDNKKIFDKTFGNYRTANFGIGGDQTQHLLWRLQHGESGNLNPKLVVMMIGVNNFGHSQHSAEQVAEGVTAVVSQVKKSFGNSKILLMGVYPFDEKATSENRVVVARTNQLLADLNDDQTVFYYDFGKLFLDDRGNIPQTIMNDFLHPSHQGYQRLSERLGPVVQQFMQ